MAIDTTPIAHDLWEGIGGHFDSLTQVLAEFVDNAAANFRGHGPPLKNVFVSIREDEDAVRVSVEDTGIGIQDLEVAFRLGDRSRQDSPLSAHGFGLKHALATADPENANWRVATRTEEDLQRGAYRELRAPYSFQMDVAEEPTQAWPGQHNGTGTYVEFFCSRRLFDSITLGVPGAQGFDRTIEYLVEDLGFIYCDIMMDGFLNIAVNSRPVATVEPVWEENYPPGHNFVDHPFSCLHGRTIHIEYHFGEMRDGQYLRRYRRNLRESGVELRLNGRAIEHGLFAEIWGLEKHGDYNHFLAKINLQDDDISVLPKTRTSKNGFREGDPVLGELFDWIRTVMPEPPRELTSRSSEKRLVEQLMDILNSVLPAADKIVTDEKRVFSTTGNPPRADIYVYDGHEVTIYEAKKDTANVQDLYQLLMDWDGLVHDGITPGRGILIASQFAPGVDAIMSMLNARHDEAGNAYVFGKATWREKQVPYPP
jgi:hypothetical protein